MTATRNPAYIDFQIAFFLLKIKAETEAAWTADFKLNAPYQTSVQGHVEDGKLATLLVTSESRANDVVVLPASN